MRVEQWTGPPVETHGYLVIDDESGEAWAVDAPMQTAAAVLAHAQERGLRLTRLVLTHGHFDHVMDAPAFTAAGVPVAMHPLDSALLEVPQPALFGLPYEMPQVEVQQALHDGTPLRLGGTEWQVWHVPGHSPGHVILYCAALATVMGGDLLFAGGYGRVDLPGSDPAAMADSLRRVLTLPGGTRVYPGHGPATTIEAERGWLGPMLSGGGPRG